jgi:hypothetical protein
MHKREAALRAGDPETVSIYTDGSGIDGSVGAAIVVPKMQLSTHQHIGSDATANVYVAELTTIYMALQQVERVSQTTSQCYIYSDNQAAVKALENPGSGSGQYVVEEILTKPSGLNSAKATQIQNSSQMDTRTHRNTRERSSGRRSQKGGKGQAH